MLILSCLFLCVGFITAQTTKVSGVVVDDIGEPVVSASVVVKGTTIGTVTDLDGHFTINVPSDKNTLVFSLVGMLPTEAKAKDGMRVVLNPDENMLGEVLVVAYGTSKKEALTGSVSAIGAADIVKRPVANVAAALEGMGTGVQVNNSYGEPGSSPSIRIRGFSSLIGSVDPLIILDGMTYNGNIGNINPEDIENISVLKDAASTALYGSRAANGVVLITTKKGKVGEKGSMTLSIRQGIINRAIPEYDRLGPDAYMQVAYDGYRNSLMSRTSKPLNLAAANAEARATLIKDILRYNIYNTTNGELFDENGVLNANASVHPLIAEDLDWFKDMERTGYRQDYNLNGTAATDKLNVFYSLGYLDEKAYVKTSDYARITGRINLSYSPRKWLTTGVNLSFTDEKANLSNGSGSGYANVFANARTIAPIYPVHVHDLNTGEYILDSYGNKQYDYGQYLTRPSYNNRNAILEGLLNSNVRRVKRNTLQAFAEVPFLEDFKFTVKGDLSNRIQTTKQYDNAVVGDGQGSNGRLQQTDYNFKEYTFSQLLTWNKTFNEEHHVDVVAAHEYYNWQRDYFFAFKTNQTITGMTVFNNFAVPNSIDSYKDQYRLESLLARLRYNYSEKYFGEFSIRRDGSSIFSPDHRWGTFWAVGGSWIVSREDFLKSVNFVDMLKLRASYGQVGNDGFSAGDYYAYLSRYTLEVNGQAGALYRSNVAYPGVTWESLNNFSAGFDARLFNKLNLTIDYFDRRNADLLLDVSRPLSAGSTNTSSASPTIRQNAGTMKNYGIEIAADVDVVRNSDFRWNLGADVTFLKNKIVKLPEEMKNGYINGTKKWMEGHGIYDFFIYQWAGVDQLTGEGLYILDPAKVAASKSDKSYRLINDKEYTTSFSQGLRDYSGSAIADAFGSVKNAFSYKDFTLNVLCTYSIGGKLLDSNYASYMSVSANPAALHADITKAWKEAPEGMDATSPNRIDYHGVPKVDYTTNSTAHTSSSTRFLEDASYFAIKNIALSYQLPKNLVEKLDLKTITLGANLENAVIFTKRKGMDPQQSFNGTADNQFLPMRTISFSLNITL